MMQRFGFSTTILHCVPAICDFMQFYTMFTVYPFLGAKRAAVRYQYQRQGEDQIDSFDLSMQNMHLLYAHDATYTFRINRLTPEDRWASMMEAPDQVVKVYDEPTDTVIPKPLRDLVPNRTPYEDRGWCMAEIEWSSVRSRSWQHQRIDSHGESDDERTLKGRVPMTPEAFENQMREAAFTHRSDATQVILLQKKVFHEKVENCEGAVLQNLPQGELGKLAESLKYYAKLKSLEVLKFECSEDEATSFGKAQQLGAGFSRNQCPREISKQRLY